jgi:serine/threonine protein kinase
MVLKIGQKFEDYTIVELLGTGGFGSVFKARHNTIMLPTETDPEPLIRAVKQLSQNQPSTIERFKREAGVLIKLTQVPGSNVTAVYDLKQVNGEYYIVMEYVPGGTLSLAARRQIEEVTLIKIAIEVCKGLEIMHNNKPGVIHRDIKPDNIKVEFLGGVLRVKILDLGIAAVLSGKPVNEVVGTYAFAGPAQMKGEFANAKMDQHSLGATLYYCMMDASLPEDKRYAPFPFERWNGKTERTEVLSRYPKGFRDVVAAQSPRIPDVWDAETIAREKLAQTKYSPQLQAIVMKLLAMDDTKKFVTIGDVQKKLEELIGVNQTGADQSYRRPITQSGPISQTSSQAPLGQSTTMGAPPPPPAPNNSGVRIPFKPKKP